MKEPSCSSCKSWVPYVDGKGKYLYGECHRFPPTSQRVPSAGFRDLFPSIFEIVTNWPRPQLTDICGEHEEGKGK